MCVIDEDLPASNSYIQVVTHDGEAMAGWDMESDMPFANTDPVPSLTAISCSSGACLQENSGVQLVTIEVILMPFSALLWPENRG